MSYSQSEVVRLPQGIGKEASLALAGSIGKEGTEEARSYLLAQHSDIPLQVLDHLNVRWGQTTSLGSDTYMTYVKITAFADSPIAADSFLRQGQMALKELVEEKISARSVSYNNKLQPSADAPAE